MTKPVSPYEELVERCAAKIMPADPTSWRHEARAVLAEVFRTLENVTEDMINASYAHERETFGPTARGLKHSAIFEKMLRASPLAAPAEKEPEA